MNSPTPFEVTMIALELKKLPEFASSELPALFPKVRDLLKAAEKEFPQAPLNGQDLPRYLDVRQVAQMLLLTERGVNQLVREHRIPCTRVASRLRFNAKALEEYLRIRTTGPRKIKGLTQEGGMKSRIRI
jgi:excisionase family DNA binding protein